MSLWQRLDWRDHDRPDEATQALALRRPVQQAGQALRSNVAEILRRVREEGDAALHDYSLRFDGVALDAFAVGEDEFAAADASVPASLKAAIADAAERIEHFHRAGMIAPCAVDTAPGVRCERIVRPIARVGLYVPAGTAPLPSTVLMLAVPARLAGCGDVALCTPPGVDGRADATVLHAARACGIDRLFKLGGAQAIAAMAHGTRSIPRCDKVFGPGNAWVTEAKRQVAADPDGAAIDMPAGPSEVLVIADAGADARFVAADLLSQAEHGPDSQVLLLSDDAALLEAVESEIYRQLEQLPRAQVARRALASSRAILVGSIAQAIDISNAYAPEHLILALREPRRYLDSVAAAGSVFLGDWAPEALGDYCSGTNHVLPTGGAARAYSGLSVASFQTQISVQAVDRRGLATIGPTAIALADAEGLEAHASAVRVRLAAA